MKRIVLASNNRGKIAEFREILSDYDVVSPGDLGISFDVEETGDTFLDNALLKAKALFELVHEPTVADDSGLCVDALGGGPGVYSARYSGGTPKDNIAKLLKALTGVTDRAAHFTSCIVYYDGTRTVVATGDTHGVIAYGEEGEGGFGYDPVFVSDDLGKSFGIATAEEKNAVSHRGRALADLKAKLGALNNN